MILLVGVKVQPAQAECGRPSLGRADTKKPDTALRSDALSVGWRLYFYVNCSLHPIHLKTYSAHNLWSSFLSCHIPFQMHKPDLVKILRFLLLSWLTYINVNSETQSMQNLLYFKILLICRVIYTNWLPLSVVEIYIRIHKTSPCYWLWVSQARVALASSLCW